MLRIKTRAVIVYGLVHEVIVRVTVAAREAAERTRSGRMTGSDSIGSNLLHRMHSGAKVLGYFLRNEDAPVHVIGVGQNRVESRGLNLRPVLELAIPGRIQLRNTAVLFLQPSAKARDGIRTITKRRVRNVGDFRPINNMRLTPQVPAIEGRASGFMARHFLQEPERSFTDARMVEAEAWRCLGRDCLAILRDEMRIGIPGSDPVGCGIDVKLHENLEPDAFRKLQHEIELLEMILILARF